ncbi:hypothetical protein, partial [Massilia timonae]|uniref:hypothetical protein n=1 Tax=Massilia timonae TaxID=47229 RepID=UPI002352E9FF
MRIIIIYFFFMRLPFLAHAWDFAYAFMSPTRLLTFFALVAPAITAIAQTARPAVVEIKGSLNVINESGQASTGLCCTN